MLFVRNDSVGLSWEILTPAIQAMESRGQADIHIYPAGSEGPSAADSLLEQDGRKWRSL
jgi:glucose-6-phosphate 1-dehydrogenase